MISPTFYPCDLLAGVDTKPQLHEPGELSSMVSGGAGAHSGHGAHGGHADPGQERPDPPATADTAAASGRDENELSRRIKFYNHKEGPS